MPGVLSRHFSLNRFRIMNDLERPPNILCSVRKVNRELDLPRLFCKSVKRTGDELV